MKKHLLLFCLLAGLAASAQTMMPLPAYSSTFTGNCRGYYFTAPTCFTITGLQVPTDVGTGLQSIAVVRLQQVPPLFSTTTNNFSVLYLTQSNATPGIIAVNIQVEQGDIIGVLGQRGTSGSYAATGYVSNVDGFPCTLNRLGMQFPLNTTAPQDLWTENSGSISRVELYYTPGIAFTASHTVLNQSDVAFVNNADTSFTSVWDYGDGSPLDTADNPTHTYVNAGTYTACTYIITSCGTDTICQSITVCGNVATAAGWTATVNGNTASFTDASSAATTWSWDFGDGSPIDNSQNPSHTYSASGTYTVCQTAINGICDTASLCDTVVICLQSTSGFTYADTNSTITFTNTSAGATGYQWDFGDATTSTASDPVHTYSANGTYNVCLIAEECMADTFCTTITTCPEVLTVAFTSSDTMTTATFTDMSSTAVGWSWNFGDSTTDSVANPIHVYSNTGQYQVCLTAWNLCGDSMTTCDSILLIITGDIPVTPEHSVTIYPNPANALTTINVSSEKQGPYSFEMMDAAGRVVHTQSGMLNQTLLLDSHELSSGSYIYRVVSDGAVIATGNLILSK